MEDQGIWEIMEPSRETSDQSMMAVKGQEGTGALTLVPTRRSANASHDEEDWEGGLGLAQGEVHQRGAHQGGAFVDVEKRIRWLVDEGGGVDRCVCWEADGDVGEVCKSRWHVG